MKPLALFILAITAIAQATPNGQHGSKQDMVKRYGSPNDLGSSVGLNSGEGDSQLDVNNNKAKHDTPRGFLTIVGADGVVNTANAHMLPATSPTGGLKAVDASSNGRQYNQQHGTKSQRKGQWRNGQQPGNGQYLDRPQSNRQKQALRFGRPSSNRLHITFVTVTVKPTGAKVSGGAGTKLPSTVTTTITVSRSAQTGGALTPNADGNGVGVTTIPIDKSALPTTTHSLNLPRPPPSAPPQPNLSSSLPPVPAPEAPVHDSHSSNGTPSSSPSSSTSSLVRQASTTLSPGSSNLGEQAPPPTPPLESTTAPVATTPPGIVAPAQPVVNLSGLTLNSILDLGKLAMQTGQAPATTAAAF